MCDANALTYRENLVAVARNHRELIPLVAAGVKDLRSLSSWTAEQFDPTLSWDDVKRIKDRWGGKLILKGILDPEDAEMAVASGAEALIVSNHGGRQLDGAVSSI